MNQLIGRITRKDRTAFIDACESRDLEFGVVLCESGANYEHVYFPTGGFISLVVEVSGHPAIEVGLIGDEGMLGATVSEDTRAAPVRGIVQGAGSCLRMSVPRFRRALKSSPSLARTMSQYQYLLSLQASRMMACAHYHLVAQRLALWLLMTHDRADGDKLELTHQFLAEMLGVQRSAVTIAAGALQERGIISYQRGRIIVHSREELERDACDCYEKMIADYKSAFPGKMN